MTRIIRKIIESCTATLLAFSMVLFAGCGNSALAPVEIAPEDMCGYCRMAISEKQYAAEFIDQHGKPEKFDDIGCMIQYIKEKKPHVAAYFVVDFNSRGWLNIEDAVLVRSSELKTPMAGGLAAFKDASQAQQAANTYRGSVVRFSELVGGLT